MDSISVTLLFTETFQVWFMGLNHCSSVKFSLIMSSSVIKEVFSCPIYGFVWGWSSTKNRRTCGIGIIFFFLWGKQKTSLILQINYFSSGEPAVIPEYLIYGQCTGMGVKCITTPLHYQIYHRVIATSLGLQRLRRKKERKILTDGQINSVLGNYETCIAESEKAVCHSQMCISSFWVSKNAFSKISQLFIKEIHY